MDEQDLLEDESVSTIRVILNGKRLGVLSLTKTDELVEVVAQKQLAVIPDFLSKAPIEVIFADFDLKLHAVPRTIDIDVRSDQTMTLSFEIVS